MSVPTHQQDLIALLEERGFVHQCTDRDGLAAHLAAGPATAYLGFDATADSLHVGHLQGLMLMRWLQKAGHRPLLLIGGATTRIGDPSFRDSSRPILTEAQIQANIDGIARVFSRYVELHDDSLVNNAEWLDGVGYLEFLDRVGRHFSINRLLTFDAIRQRLDREHSLSFLEFGYTLLHIFVVLFFIEVALRVWGMSLIRYAEGEGEQISMKVVSFGTTLLVAWLIWILTDTAIQHSLGLGGKSRPNTRALTMLPLIRNVLFATIAVIALIVALANMGMNVTPLLAGAGVIGLAIGFGAQSLVADLITGLFIIIEDSLSIDDYVDVGGHLGTVEGLTIRTVRLRDLDGVVHTIPFSEIKSIKNYSRQFGYAMFRWPVPASMPIDDAVALVREVAMELRSDPAVYRNLWSPMELQGVESFDNGQAILRFRFKTAPIKQWEVQRAFNLRLRRRLDQAGLELSMPRLNVQLSRAPKAKSAEPDEPGTPADGGI